MVQCQCHFDKYRDEGLVILHTVYEPYLAPSDLQHHYYGFGPFKGLV